MLLQFLDVFMLGAYQTLGGPILLAFVKSQYPQYLEALDYFGPFLTLCLFTLVIHRGSMLDIASNFSNLMYGLTSISCGSINFIIMVLAAFSSGIFVYYVNTNYTNEKLSIPTPSPDKSVCYNFTVEFLASLVVAFSARLASRNSKVVGSDAIVQHNFVNAMVATISGGVTHLRVQLSLVLPLANLGRLIAPKLFTLRTIDDVITLFQNRFYLSESDYRIVYLLSIAMAANMAANLVATLWVERRTLAKQYLVISSPNQKKRDERLERLSVSNKSSAVNARGRQKSNEDAAVASAVADSKVGSTSVVRQRKQE